ncbi:hypothetical protein HMPREF1141_1441 [Clostridium sp. MSTE9]|nr:hypothetical protein HMPREF1141_1441 [Clostridium sp. MSTE9]
MKNLLRLFHEDYFALRKRFFIGWKGDCPLKDARCCPQNAGAAA